MLYRPGKRTYVAQRQDTPFEMVFPGDDDGEQFRIHVEVDNPIVGTLFEYRGSFTVERHDCERVPDAVQPTVTRQRE